MSRHRTHLSGIDAAQSRPRARIVGLAGAVGANQGPTISPADVRSMPCAHGSLQYPASSASTESGFRREVSTDHLLWTRISFLRTGVEGAAELSQVPGRQPKKSKSADSLHQHAGSALADRLDQDRCFDLVAWTGPRRGSSTAKNSVSSHHARGISKLMEAQLAVAQPVGAVTSASVSIPTTPSSSSAFVVELFSSAHCSAAPSSLLRRVSCPSCCRRSWTSAPPSLPHHALGLEVAGRCR